MARNSEDRVQVADPSERSVPELRTTSRPVDTFYRVAEQEVAKPDVSGLMSLTKALADYEPKLQKFLVSTNEAMIAGEIKKARQDRINNQMSFAEATKLWESSGGKQGIPPGMNPYYVKEYNRVDGEENSRNEYRMALHEAVQASGLNDKTYDSEALAAQDYAKFVGNFRSEYLKKHSGTPDWLDGFETAREGIESSVAGYHISQRIAANEEKFGVAKSAEISTTLQDESLSPEQKAQRISEIGAGAVGQFGFSGTKFNKLAVNALAGEALKRAEDGDYSGARDVLEMADSISTGNGKLGKITEARDKIVDTGLRITAIQRQNVEYERSKVRWNWALQDRPHQVEAQKWAVEHEGAWLEDRKRAETERDEKGVRELEYQRSVMDILANPTKDQTDNFQKLAGDKNTAKIIEGLAAFQRQRISADEHVHEDPATFAKLKTDVLRGTAGPEDIMTLVTKKGLSTPHVSELLQDWDRVKRTQAGIDKLPQHIREIAKQTADGIYTTLRGTDEFISDNPDRLPMALQAQQQSRRMFLEWAEANPKATELDALKQQGEITQAILNNPGYRPNIGKGQDGVVFKSTDTLRDEADGKVWPTPPTEKIQLLWQHPNQSPDFDKKYGPGAAAKALLTKPKK